MKNLTIIFSLLLVFLLSASPSYAEEHAIQRGETALQIALDHNLTMDQLTKLNPGIDLEMMMVGDILIVPDEGTSFEEYLSKLYGEKIRITDINCDILADQSALCLFHTENLTELPLYEVEFTADIRGQNGTTSQAEGLIPLMQILSGEKMPCSLIIPGHFDSIENVAININNLTQSEMLQSSFRIPEDYYSVTENFLPDGVAAISTIQFNDTVYPKLQDKQINILAAAYDTDGSLAGVRSLFSDFYPRMDITVYTNNHKIGRIELKMEAY